MRIPCPDCGQRDSSEFVYLGDASPRRPDSGSDEAQQFVEYVYLRENPAGELREFWYHALGCRGWIVVQRDTLTHEIAHSMRAIDWQASR